MKIDKLMAAIIIIISVWVVFIFTVRIIVERDRNEPRGKLVSEGTEVVTTSNGWSVGGTDIGIVTQNEKVYRCLLAAYKTLALSVTVIVWHALLLFYLFFRPP